MKSISTKLLSLFISIIAICAFMAIALFYYYDSKKDKFFHDEVGHMAEKTFNRLVLEYRLGLERFMMKYLNDESIYTLIDKGEYASLQTNTNGILRGLALSSADNVASGIITWNFVSLDGKYNSIAPDEIANQGRALIDEHARGNCFATMLQTKQEGSCLETTKDNALYWIFFPTTDDNEKINGFSEVAVSLMLPATKIKEILNGEVSIINNKNQVIFSTNREFIPEIQRNLKDKEVDDILWQNRNYKSMLRPLNSQRPDVGNIAFSIDETESTKTEEALTRLLFIGFSVGMIAIIFIIIFVVRKNIVAPVLLIKQKAVELADGKFIKITNINDKTELGDCLKSMNQMIDVLNEVNQELVEISAQTIRGKLNYRINFDKYNGEYKKMTEGINKIIDEILRPNAEVIKILKEMEHGNLSLKVSGDYKGDHAVLKDAINSTIDSLNMTLAEVKGVVAQVNNSAEIMSGHGGNLTSGSSRQASSLEEISGSLIQISSQIERQEAH